MVWTQCIAHLFYPAVQVMFFSDSAMSILQGMQFLTVYVSLKLFDYLYTWIADYIVFELAGLDIIADAWSRVLREVLLFVFSFSFLGYVLYRRPETRGRFRLTGAGAPRLQREDWRRFIADAVSPAVPRDSPYIS